MSSLRGRTRDSSWQWLLIGIVLGLGCSGVMCLALYAVNYLHIGPPTTPDTAALGTTVLVVTTTPLPATATSPATASPAPTKAGSSANAAPTVTVFQVLPTTDSGTNVSVPNPTATFDGTPITSAPTPAPTKVGPDTSANPPVSGGTTVATLAPSIVPSPLIPLTGGSFTMGTTTKEMQQAVDDCATRDKGHCDINMASDAFPPHQVYINNFSLEQYEVSYDQYIAFLNYLGPSSHLKQCGGFPCAAMNDASHQASYIKFNGTQYTLTNAIYHNRPVANVTWYGADTYCKTIGRRLPSEAEWEYAARGSGQSERLYPWGNDWDPTKARTSRPKNEGGPDTVDAFKTGSTPEGILNLAGNVAEWVNDWYDPGYYKNVPPNGIDPTGPTSGSNGTKVARGGSWDALPFFARAVQRQDFDPAGVFPAVGFRCAADQNLSQPTSAAGASSSGSSGQTQPLTVPDQPTETSAPR